MTKLKWHNLLEIMRDNDEYTEAVARKLDLSHGYRPLQNLVESLKYDNIDLTETDILEALMKDLIQILENRKNKDREGYILRKISYLIQNYPNLVNENSFVKLLKLQNFLDFEQVVSKKRGDFALAAIIASCLEINKKLAFLKNDKQNFVILSFTKSLDRRNTFEESANFMKFLIIDRVLDCCNDENFYDRDFFEQIYSDLVLKFQDYYSVEEYLDFQLNDCNTTIRPSPHIFLLMRLARILTKTFLHKNLEKYKGDWYNQAPTRVLKAISYIAQREKKIIELKFDFKEKSIKNESNEIEYQLTQIEEMGEYLYRVSDDVGYPDID